MKKTSYDWVQELRIEVKDPDGWDRKNFEYSWFEEQITKEEFMKRVSHSTIINYGHRDN